MVEFKKILSFQIVHLMNLTMTLNIIDMTTLIITMTGPILYVKDNPLVDMVLQLNNRHLIAIQYTHFIIQEQDTFGLFSFSGDAVER